MTFDEHKFVDLQNISTRFMNTITTYAYDNIIFSQLMPRSSVTLGPTMQVCANPRRVLGRQRIIFPDILCFHTLIALSHVKRL